MSNLNTLVVNGVYLNRLGNIVIIKSYDPDIMYPFCSAFDKYQPNGIFYNTPTNYDLIKYLGTLNK